MSDWYVRNFTATEVSCPCCGKENMAFHTILKFQIARDILGVPLYGTSWCRCPIHNAKVGGVKDSSHLITPSYLIPRECTAGDITVVDGAWRPMTSRERHNLHDALREAGFTRFGLHKFYIHVDDNPDKLPRMEWLY